MFGILKGASCSMDMAQKDLWMSHICGTCFALQDQAGFASRIATNYDAALLSALVEAQLPPGIETQDNVCPLRQPFRFKVINPDSPGVKYASTMALLMAGTKIQDHLLDGESSLKYFQKAAQWISKRWISAARKTSRDIGIGFHFV